VKNEGYNNKRKGALELLKIMLKTPPWGVLSGLHPGKGSLQGRVSQNCSLITIDLNEDCLTLHLCLRRPIEALFFSNSIKVIALFFVIY